MNIRWDTRAQTPDACGCSPLFKRACKQDFKYPKWKCHRHQTALFSQKNYKFVKRKSRGLLTKLMQWAQGWYAQWGMWGWSGGTSLTLWLLSLIGGTSLTVWPPQGLQFLLGPQHPLSLGALPPLSSYLEWFGLLRQDRDVSAVLLLQHLLPPPSLKSPENKNQKKKKSFKISRSLRFVAYELTMSKGALMSVSPYGNS